MTTTVTVSEFRQNLAKYLDLLKEGHFVELTDGRKNKTVLKLQSVNENTIDWDAHIKKMKSYAGKGYFVADEDDRKKVRARVDKRLRKRVLYE